MNAPHRPWRPLLVGEEAAAAHAVVLDIAERLRNPAGTSWEINPLAADLPRSVSRRAASFSSGAAGIAVFFAYLHQFDADQGYEATSLEYLNAALERVEEPPFSWAFFGGLPGVAWTATHLSDPQTRESSCDPVSDVDDLLAEHLARPARRGDFDLISGLVGCGVFALERLPRPGAAHCLARIVQQLDDMAEKRPGGVTWLTPPDMVPRDHLSRAPCGYYNFGVAHGVPGVIALLASARAAGIARSTADSLLEGAVAWLKSCALPPGGDTVFPKWIPKGMPMREPSRLAWCYGDPGIAATLLHAARCADEPAWGREAVRWALAAAATPLSRSGVLDAGLCHGAAGLTHLFNRMYQATGEEPLSDAARIWLQRTLGLRREGEGIAGFLSYKPQPDPERPWVAQSGFLTGAAGIGLALLTAISSLEPAWDRALLLSGARR
jgi:lantibiotic modifying enzyme